MHIVRHLFLENPLGLWVVLGLAEIVALVVWDQTRSKRAAWCLVAFPVAGMLLGVLDLAVETDAEQLNRTLRTMARGVAEGNAEAIIECISPDYCNGSARKEDLARVVRLAMRQVRAKAQSPNINWGENEATVRQVYVFESVSGARRAVHPRSRVVLWEGVFAPDADGEWRLRWATALRPKRITPEQAVRYLPLQP